MQMILRSIFSADFSPELRFCIQLTSRQHFHMFCHHFKFISKIKVIIRMFRQSCPLSLNEALEQSSYTLPSRMGEKSASPRVFPFLLSSTIHGCFLSVLCHPNSDPSLNKYFLSTYYECAGQCQVLGTGQKDGLTLQ